MRCEGYQYPYPDENSYEYEGISITKAGGKEKFRLSTVWGKALRGARDRGKPPRQSFQEQILSVPVSLGLKTDPDPPEHWRDVVGGREKSLKSADDSWGNYTVADRHPRQVTLVTCLPKGSVLTSLYSDAFQEVREKASQLLYLICPSTKYTRRAFLTCQLASDQKWSRVSHYVCATRRI